MRLLARIRAWFGPRPRLTLALPPPPEPTLEDIARQRALGVDALHEDEAASLRRMHER